jgi:hypothetical protein
VLSFWTDLPGGDQLGFFLGLILLFSFFSCIKNMCSVLIGHTYPCHAIALLISFNLISKNVCFRNAYEGDAFKKARPLFLILPFLHTGQ